MRQSHPQGKSQKPGNLAAYPGCGGIGRRGSELVMGLLPLPRSVFDGRFDPATLDEEESRLLLAAMVNDYEQMRARESEKAQKTEGSR